MRYAVRRLVHDTASRVRRDAAHDALEPQVVDLLELLSRNARPCRHQARRVRGRMGEHASSPNSALTTRLNAARAAIGDNGSAQRRSRRICARACASSARCRIRTTGRAAMFCNVANEPSAHAMNRRRRRGTRRRIPLDRGASFRSHGDRRRLRRRHRRRHPAVAREPARAVRHLARLDARLPRQRARSTIHRRNAGRALHHRRQRPPVGPARAHLGRALRRHDRRRRSGPNDWRPRSATCSSCRTRSSPSWWRASRPRCATPSSRARCANRRDSAEQASHLEQLRLAGLPEAPYDVTGAMSPRSQPARVAARNAAKRPSAIAARMPAISAW